MPSIIASLCLVLFLSLVSVWDKRAPIHLVAAAATIESSSHPSCSTASTTTPKPFTAWKTRLASTSTNPGRQPQRNGQGLFRAFLPLALRGGGGGGSYLGHQEEDEQSEQGNKEKYRRKDQKQSVERDYENDETRMENVRSNSQAKEEKEEEEEGLCNGGEDYDILDVEEEELVHLLEEEEREECSAAAAAAEYFPDDEVIYDADFEQVKRETLLQEHVSAQEKQASPKPEMVDSSLEKEQTRPNPKRRTTTKRRKTFDMNVDLITRSGVDGNAESIALRHLIMQRRDEHLRHLIPSSTHQQHQHRYDQDNVIKEETDADWEKQYHPKRLLHFIAPKIPAIKHSRDVALRIQSAQSDVDAGVAACLISSLAQVSEAYSNKAAAGGGKSIIDTDESSSKKKHAKTANVARDLIQDRRFEQLVECILCGLDVHRRKREYLRIQLEERRLMRKEEEHENLIDGIDKASLHHVDAMDDEAQMLLEEDVAVDEGLSIRDACRAAWGLASLGVFKTQTMSDTKGSDILLALSLRIRELLLARIQALRQDDLFDDNRENVERSHDNNGQINMNPNVDLVTAMAKRITIEERIMIIAEEIAEDAATAMWTFAYVAAIYGDTMSDADGSSFTTPLMKVCIFLLCHDPIKLRRQAQEEVVLDQSVGKDTAGLALIQRHRVTGRKEIGSNDAVERLARAEEAEKEALGSHEQYGVTTTALGNQAAFERQENSKRESTFKDALLDRLSPSEITDVLWSLATFTNRDASTMPSTREDHGLSEAASILCSIAFDHLLAYVRQDLETVHDAEKELRKRKTFADTRPVHEHDVSKEDGPLEFTAEAALTEYKANDTSAMTGEQQATVVEDYITIKTAEEGRIGAEEVVHVVDAASLLASEAQKSGGIRDGSELRRGPPSSPPPSLLQDDEMVESLTITNSDRGGDGEEVVNVEDAASLLVAPQAEHGSVASEWESLAGDLDRQNLITALERTSPNFQWQLLFSIHDLCAMTWAATKLCDSVRWCSITAAVSQLIVELGKSSLEGCTEADLSNLAWALAKRTTEGTHAQIPEGRMVAAWIAEIVHKESGAMEDSVIERARSIQSKFQPPQLSRLLWSISCSLSDERDRSIDLEVPGKLALAGLQAASNNLQVYGTEDLVRIAWAFLELNDLDVVRTEHPGAIAALGRVIESIELSLTDWESGNVPLSSKTSTERAKEHFRFRSFFGKTRFHAAALQQKLEEGIEDSNVEDFPILHSERKTPLLKNLPVDPATLCKLVHSCSQGSTTTTGIKGWDKLGRITLRLMTSRHGRLLRECHSRDLACLCKAATLMVSTSSRELVALFARRVVAVLNDSPDLLLRAPPHVHVDLLLSLGCLGVKHLPQSTTPLPYRRLQLTIVEPFIRTEDLHSLPDHAYMSLIKGLVSLNAMSSDPDYIVVVLKGLIDRLPSLLQGASICDLADALGALHEGENAATATATKNSTDAELNEEEPPVDAASRVLSMSRDLLSQVANAIITRVGELTAVNLRKLLQVYARTRLQADDLVEAIDADVQRRREHLIAAAKPETEGNNLEDALLHVAANAAFIKRALIGEGEAEQSSIADPFRKLRKGLQSIFGRDKASKTPSSNSSSKEHQESVKNESEIKRDKNANEPNTAEIAPNSADASLLVESEEDRHEKDTILVGEIEQSIDALMEAVFVAQDLAAFAAANKDNNDETKILQDLFELGRCGELIANYRQRHFESGAIHESRVDSDEGSRRDVAKRVLSQLLP